MGCMKLLRPWSINLAVSANSYIGQWLGWDGIWGRINEAIAKKGSALFARKVKEVTYKTLLEF